MIGKTVSHYRVVDKLGGGGMGVVYKAQDTTLDRFVALKFLSPHLGQTDSEKRRFIQEAKAASALDHPNICTIHEIGESDDGQLFIVMACYEGESLKEKISRGPLPADEAVAILTQAARGVAAAHERGIVHRDIKPANVILTVSGEVKIVDFGLAKLASETRLTKTGTAVGTAAYMSPEQINGGNVDHRTDLWSLGAVLYEMLTGQAPFRADYEPAVLYSILNQEAEPISSLRPEVPERLQLLVSKAMRKNPAERYQDTRELLADLGAPPDKSDPGPGRRKTGGGRRAVSKWLYAAGGLVALSIVMGALYLLVPHGSSIDSIAVLPLANLSADPEQEYFVDGMTEALITDLGRISSLRVISRTSIAEYKGTTKSLSQIGKELNVQAIVEGSVLRSDNQVRITAKLIRVAEDRQLWGDSYERDLKDVLALQSEVARSIAREVNIKLTSMEQARLGSTSAVDTEAYEAYLKGRYFLQKEEMEKSHDFLQLAIDKDPNYAPAYAALADYYGLLPFVSNALPADVFPQAKAMALKAVELDKNLSEGYASLAYVQTYYDWDWKAADKTFQRALELNPNSVTVRHMYSRFLSSQGRLDEARVQLNHARELDPLDLGITANAGVISYFGRQYDRAIEELNATLELDPHFSVAVWGLGMVYEQKQMYPEAISKLEEVAALSHGNNAMASLGHAYAEAGMRDKAQEVLRGLMDKTGSGYVPSYYIALVNAGLGEKDAAFQWLDKAYQERSTLLCYMKMDPRLDSLHMDPRFPDLLHKIGLAE